MKKGATQYVVEDDLPSLVPSDDSERLSEKLEAALIKQYERSALFGHSMLTVIYLAHYGKPFLWPTVDLTRSQGCSKFFKIPSCCFNPNSCAFSSLLSLHTRLLDSILWARNASLPLYKDS